jgi:hypothetical protein
MTHNLVISGRMKIRRHDPIEKLEHRAQHLHEIEHLGESAAAPLIAILGLVLFFATVCIVVGALSFAAYYLAL